MWDVDLGVLQLEQCPVQGAGRYHPSAKQESSGGMDREETNRMIGWLLEKIEGLETENAGLCARIENCWARFGCCGRAWSG